jgi:dihydroflavonol-4-reductase
MKTLVTGATGLVGNNVVRMLIERGEPVRVMVRANSDPRPLEGLDVEVAHGDVRDEAAIRKAATGVDRVVHAAAQVHIGWKKLEEQRAINVVGTRLICEAALAEGIPLVHVSSVDALGLAAPGTVADEETPRAGKTLCSYVVTKSEAEAEVRRVIERGLDARIVNPGFMLGPWDWKPSSGRMLLGVGKRFAALAPTGGCTICDVRDVAAGIVATLERGNAGRNYILGGFNKTYFELWQQFARVGGSRPAVARLGPAMQFVVGRSGDWLSRLVGRELDVNSAALAMSSLFHYHSSARANAELGYQNRPLEQTIQDAWDWFRAYGYV